MSSSKRGKRRKKKGELERYAEKRDSKKDEVESVDFTFLMLGMITSVMALLFVSSLFTTPPKAKRALEAARTGEATEEVKATDDEEFDRVLEDSDVNQLTNILSGLNRVSRHLPPNESAKSHQRRIETANHMLGKKLSNDQRKLAIEAKLNALTTVYGLNYIQTEGVPNVAESLRDTAGTYVDSPDAEVQKLAKLCLVKVNSFEMTKDGNEMRPALLVDEMCKLLKGYPGDELVIATVDTIIKHLRGNFDRAVGVEITNGIKARESEFVDSPKVAKMLRDFEDEEIMSDAKYSQLYENRWVNGKRGQRELLKKSLQLAAEPNAGNLLIGSVDKVAHWFEEDDQYEIAVSIYQEILNSVDTYRDPEVAAVAKKKAQDGIARSKIVGEEIDLSGLLLNGAPHPLENIKGRVAVVVFWSMYERDSIQTLSKVAVSGKVWKERGIRILAVNIDRSWKLDLITEITQPIENVIFLYGNPNDNYSNNILSQCPSDLVPRLMLVGRDGHVADINVPFDEVETQLDFLD